MGNLISAAEKDLDSPKKTKNGYHKRDFSLKIPRSATAQIVSKPPKPKSAGAAAGGDKSSRSGAATSEKGSTYEFQKSQSMHELQYARRKSAHSKRADSDTASTSSGKPASLKQVRVNSSESDKSSSNASLSTSKAPFARQRSVRRVDPNHPITPSGREIIQYCFESAHNDLGHRICTRLYEKRPDYQRFIQTMGKDKWPQMTNNLKCFLENVVANIDSLQMIERLSRQYGEEHVEVKVYGFKPDFWVSLADALIIECVILDQANHQPTDTVSAWSQLVTLMFTSIRDGYYHALRTQRISTRKKNLQRQESVGTVEGGSPERSTNGEIRPSPRPASLYVNNRQSVSVPNGLSPPAASGRAFHKSESQSPTMMTRPIFE